MKRFIRRLAPAVVLLWYHRLLAAAADAYYGHPSRRLVVIGVTGTKGKTTTSYLIAKLLEAAGHTTGLASTAVYKVAGREWLNTTKMTMLGRFRLQRLLRDMARAGVSHAVIETSSEGILQSRHRGIWYDMAVFTNLTPDHLESHGSFDAYRAAKGELFRAIMSHPRKALDGTSVARVSVVNADDENAAFFLKFPADGVVRYHTLGKMLDEKNIEAAVAVVVALGMEEAVARAKIVSIPPVPGRLERVSIGQPFTVMVDYAHEPASFAALYDVVSRDRPKWIIHVFGATGGGRDRARRPAMGEIAAKYADRVIITTDDPYDDDPQQLANDVLAGVPEDKRKAAMIILDRRAAIERALRDARSGDLILITGKGSEQTQVLAGGKIIPWDDRVVVREILKTSPLF